MKKRDDDLLRLAFGDLSAENARAVEARLAGDASARAELESMRELRAGLQRLPPPPPDTLSADRLRAAILDRELRSRRATPFFAWAWAPVAAAAACVAVLAVSRPSSKGGTPVLVAPDAVALAGRPIEPTESDFDSLFVAPESADSVLADAAPRSAPDGDSASSARKSNGREAAKASERSGPRRAHRRAAAPEAPTYAKRYAMNATLAEDAVSASVEATAKEPETMAAPVSAVVDGGPYAGGPESVVIVSSKRDLDTGAHAATETEASNVLVGG